MDGKNIYFTAIFAIIILFFINVGFESITGRIPFELIKEVHEENINGKYSLTIRYFEGDKFYINMFNDAKPEYFKKSNGFLLYCSDGCNVKDKKNLSKKVAIVDNSLNSTDYKKYKFELEYGDFNDYFNITLVM